MKKVLAVLVALAGVLVAGQSYIVPLIAGYPKVAGVFAAVVAVAAWLLKSPLAQKDAE